MQALISLLEEVTNTTEKAFAPYDFSSKSLILRLYTYGPTTHVARRNMDNNLRAQLYFKSIFEEYIRELYGDDTGFKIHTNRYLGIPTVVTKGIDGEFYSRDIVSISRMLTKKFGSINVEINS